MLQKTLQKKTAPYKNITTYGYAVSDTTGNAPLHIAEKKSGTITQASSLRAPYERLQWSPIQFPYTIPVPTITLDAWATEYIVHKIDFLWLDAQGHELSILRASPQILSTVQLLYTEVGFVEAYTGQDTADAVCEWLCMQGFIPVAKDFTDTSSWFFGNILFVRNHLLQY
jgi:FkbM family methyltransferase